jgi:hypothetical protein
MLLKLQERVLGKNLTVLVYVYWSDSCYTGNLNSVLLPGRNLHEIKYGCSNGFAVTECLELTGYESPSILFRNLNLSDCTGKRIQYIFGNLYAGKVGLKVCNSRLVLDPVYDS